MNNGIGSTLDWNSTEPTLDQSVYSGLDIFIKLFINDFNNHSYTRVPFKM